VIKSFLVSLLVGAICAPAIAKNDLQTLNKSILKIALFLPTGPAVATTFAVSQNNEKFMVTNNHVCDGFYKSKRVVLIESGALDELPRGTKLLQGLDEVTEYYMDPGTDICVFKSKNMSKYNSLVLNKENASPTEDIIIAGFVGRSMDLMYVDGKIYGSVTVEHPVELKDCLIDPPDHNTSGTITCGFFPQYPTYVKKKLQTAVNNIGPGFSGSPVLQEGKVSGIVCRYFVPAQGYGNGDVIFFPVADIKNALDRAGKLMVRIDSTEYKKIIRISAFDEELRIFLRSVEEDLKDIIPDLLRRIDE